MGKDPAFLFYSSDFLTGVSDLTMTERGQYITLMCLQHQKGHLSEKTICLTLGLTSVTEIKDLLLKYKRDEDGNFYNLRLETEIELRANFIESRKLNGSKGGRPVGSGKASEKLVVSTSKASEKLVEDVNENAIKDKSKDTNTDIFIGRDFSDEIKEAVVDWLTYKKEKRQPYKPVGIKSLLTQINNKIYELGELGVIKAITESMACNYTGIIWDKGNVKSQSKGFSFLDPDI